ncbi:hypothetical protein BTO06_16485 [Tenacibaculum sp. SZ-18]|uniref:hypothetical protein n=1 Tax=Tenacibaculum sp. SZ-18 TaxID=754423 RepID=UPI000C2D4BED|nr:hypothetical protein [Tenacibaculum sp. SZ-18]AUC16645.1 hypothetical protein BTO06_16485 [Tenacibaculum sp. SZ-18]
MKTKYLILFFGLLLFQSCIVKSLNPFYTEDVIQFSEDFAGEWKDNNNDSWKIVPTKEEYKRLKKKGGQLSIKDKTFFETYKNSYLVEYSDNTKTSHFIATPFKINNQYFLDFIPYSNDGRGVNSLLQIHNVYAHSLVKLDVLNSEKISIKWFDEKRLKKLFDERKIKIKHEKIGIMKEDILLTASSKELLQFLKKYMASDVAKKWETETKFTLKKS